MRLSILLAVCCSLALAETSSVTGTVASTADSSPIAGARVTLSSANASQTLLTDVGGSFTFDGVPAGTYTVSADRDGYFAGGSERNAASAAVSVDAQGKSGAVSLRLTPGVTFTGTVCDQSGAALPSASVSLIRRVVVEGRARLAPFRQIAANDLGEFRVSGLPAGKYLVCAYAAASSWQRHHGSSYAPTCFPDATDPSAVQWSIMAPGQSQALAFHLGLVHGVRITGTVAGAGQGTSVWITRTGPRDVPQIDNPEVNWDPKTASFQALAVPPGEYRITASSPEGGQQYHAAQTIGVGASDIRGIRLTLRNAPDLHLTIHMNDGGEQQPQSRTGVGIGDGALSIYANSPGPFEQTLPDPGDYSVRVFPLPGWTVRSVTQGGIDIRDRKITIADGVDPAPIDIVLTQGGGGSIDVSLSKTLAEGRTPVMVTLLRQSSASNEWVEQGQSIMFQGPGALRLSNIPAGEYRLYGWPASSEVEYLNPEVLRNYQSFGEPVTVRVGETVRVIVQPVRVE